MPLYVEHFKNKQLTLVDIRERATLAAMAGFAERSDSSERPGLPRMMTGEVQIPGGVVHDLPGDLEDALKVDPDALATWIDITPLARNEWICWIESAKKAETRRKRIDWGRSNLSDGKRRPCCWPGCPHR